MKLLERAAGARAKGPAQEGAEPPVCHSLNILVGIAEVRKRKYSLSRFIYQLKININYRNLRIHILFCWMQIGIRFSS